MPIRPLRQRDRVCAAHTGLCFGAGHQVLLLRLHQHSEFGARSSAVQHVVSAYGCSCIMRTLLWRNNTAARLFDIFALGACSCRKAAATPSPAPGCLAHLCKCSTFAAARSVSCQYLHDAPIYQLLSPCQCLRLKALTSPVCTAANRCSTCVVSASKSHGALCSRRCSVCLTYFADDATHRCCIATMPHATFPTR